MSVDVVPARHVIDNTICIKQILGQGSFGAAYYAKPYKRQSNTQQTDGDAATPVWPQEFVVKMMRRGEFSHHDIESIHREVEALRQLKHPHIVQYIDAWVETGASDYKGYYCLAINYCNGGDMLNFIRHRMQKHEYISKEMMVQLIVQVFSALNYCHAHKIIHRDIKPANIFLQCDDVGTVEKVMLGDFGLSRPLENTIQLAKTRVGTPLYCSPEIVRGKSYGTKTDIFSAGVLFYELMTLEKAFTRPRHGDKLMCDAIIHQNPVPRLYDLAHARYGDNLVSIVSACLSKAESCRPSAYDVLTTFSSRVRLLLRETNLTAYNEGRTSPVKAGKSPITRRTPLPSPERHTATPPQRTTSRPRQVVTTKGGSPTRDGNKREACAGQSLHTIVHAVAKAIKCSVEDDVLRLLDNDVEMWLMLKIIAVVRASSSAEDRERVMCHLLRTLKPESPSRKIARIASSNGPEI